MNKKVIDGILINPEELLNINCEDFVYPNELFFKPFILFVEYVAPDNSYEGYCKRLKNLNLNIKLETKREFNDRIKKDKEDWFKTWGSDGIRYDVKMIDCGAMDRPTHHGSFSNLEQAIIKAKTLI